LLLLILPTSAAHAAKQPVDFFGGEGTQGGQFASGLPAGIAVNYTGAGGVPAGTIYVVDGGGFDIPGERGNRIQRFQRDDNGTPAETTDDTYSWVAAWGAGVETGGSNYEICTTAANCGKGTGQGGNGTVGGDGSLNKPGGIAVDEDTGDVYVVDSSPRRTLDNHFRVNVYSATGAFLRSFGWDVVESGPDNTGTGYEICVAANGDVCKKGIAGAGVGQIGVQANGEKAAGDIAVSPPDGSPATGAVYVSDSFNRRVNTYALDGSSPSFFGSAATFTEASPQAVTVDSRGIVYALDGNSTVERYDSQNADGGGIGFLAPISLPVNLRSLAVDPDGDGAGPDSDVLYAGSILGGGNYAIRQFGPLNAPGLTAPPATFDAAHGDNGVMQDAQALAVEPQTGRLYAVALGQAGAGVYVLDNTGPPPTASLDSLDNVTATSVDLQATVDPNGPPDTSYRFEYRRDSDPSWKSTPLILLGHQESPQSIDTTIDEAPAGLEPNTLYHFRVVAQRKLAQPVISNELTAKTSAAAPIATTTGAPIRTTTTARLTGRIVAQNSATTYRFEYGADASYSQSTPSMPAGSANTIELLGEEITGLEPNTTYHYRLVAENGTAGPSATGQDMTVTTRGAEAPLSHAGFPGPTGSDRAWELVSMPDSNGNPVSLISGFSDSGDRAAYGIAGGTPLSNAGNFFSIYLTQRPPGAHPTTGWQTKLITPERDQLEGTNWLGVFGRSDLGSDVAVNSIDDTGTVWRLSPDAPAQRLFTEDPPLRESGGPGGASFTRLLVSADSSRVVLLLEGTEPDPAFPAAGSIENYYDVSGGGTPRLLSLLPSGQPPACGVALPLGMRIAHALSGDGSHFYFTTRGDECSSPPRLYVRDIPAEQTKLVSGPPLSGPSCAAAFVKGTEGAAFFVTATRLVAADSEPSASCTGGNDIYRYRESDGSLECVTCLVPGVATAVLASQTSSGAAKALSIADDGSRIYFRTATPLRPGTVAGEFGTVYRLNLGSGDLVALPSGVRIGDLDPNVNLSHDGRFLAFTSSSPELNPLGGGSDNGGTLQRYLYDDHDGSLTCVSCPQDGSQPLHGLSSELIVGVNGGGQPNLRALADNGTFAFSTTTPLIGGDQNTPPPQPGGGDPYETGTDVYEYRDGRQLLVTDGLTEWPLVPTFTAIDPSGRDIFFIAPARLTSDAIDGSYRLYDARIGGGMDFPPPPKPCPLEVCQGTPKGASEEQAPSSATFSGSGNPAPPASGRCAKGRVRRKGRCVPSHRKRHAKHAHKRAAKHNRRAAR
jgi:hypothetical protein